jgi:hypothetical protein
LRQVVFQADLSNGGELRFQPVDLLLLALEHLLQETSVEGGGQAEVYRAVHPSLGRDVAIKLSRQTVSQEPALREPGDHVELTEDELRAKLEEAGLRDMQVVEDNIAMVRGTHDGHSVLILGGHGLADEPMQMGAVQTDQDLSLDHVRRIEAVCADHGVRLIEAALQFVLGHPAVRTVIPGAVNAAEVEANVAILSRELPDALWSDLKSAGLLRRDVPTPGGN